MTAGAASLRRRSFVVGGRVFGVDRPAVVAILNVTPDSFHDGGRHNAVDAALRRAERCVDEGADILDVGGESTRPSAVPPSPDEERARILPVIEALTARAYPLPISVDTSRAEVLADAFDRGALMWNDVRSGRDRRGLRLAAERGASVVLMHMRGEPATMAGLCHYDDVGTEVCAELRPHLDAAREAGLDDDHILLDPGVGFAKTADQSVDVLRQLPKLAALGPATYVGASRKSLLGRRFALEGEDRLTGSLAIAAAVAYLGAAALRVHDVRETRQLLDVLTPFLPGAP